MKQPATFMLGLIAVALGSGCDGGDSSSASSGGAGGTTATGGTTSTGGVSGSAGTGGSAGDDGGSVCTLPNGQITPTGSFAASISGSSANLDVPAPKDIPCQIEFMAAGGTNLGDGNGQTGSTIITCHGESGPLFYGFQIDILFRPKAGQSYPAGVASAIPAGAGIYKYNGQATFRYVEGPICDTLQDKSKQWNASVGTLTVDSVTGATVKLTLAGVKFAPASGELNYKGTGDFELAGSGSADVVDK